MREFVHQFILLPLLYVWWLLRLFYHSVPQLIFWGFFMLLAALILLRSLFRHEGKRSETSDVIHGEYFGPVQTWAHWIQWAKQSHYSRWRLARRLAELTQDILVYQDQLSIAEARRILDAGELEAPVEVRAYLQKGRARHHFTSFSRFRHVLTRKKQPSALELDPERVIEFLEERLEVRRDH
ncbi:MAG: hypothetical protein JXA37_08910 [Chloroflexia bacterium]|nr:hypothetical protein [Chloroflexia bacterium]